MDQLSFDGMDEPRGTYSIQWIVKQVGKGFKAKDWNCEMVYELRWCDGTYYIGYTNSPKFRFLNHRRWMKKGRHGNPKVQEKYDKLGLPSVEIMATGPTSAAVEQDLIAIFGEDNLCLNMQGVEPDKRAGAFD